MLGILLIAAAGLVSTRDADASTFSATLTITVPDSASGAQSDITSEFDIPAPNANFGAVIGFTPASWGLGSCPANDPASASASCADGTIPNGARAGLLTSDATLGLLNNPCNQPIQVSFNMLDATTSGGSTTFETQFADDDGDGVPNGAEAYPDYLTRILTDGSTPLQPIQRLYGQTSVGGTNVSLNFVIFAPGITLQGQQLDPSLGYPSVAVLQNTGDPTARPLPSGITDFCTPLSTRNTTFGMTQDNPDTAANEGGMTYRTNPADGGYNFTTYARSQRDADDDGIENALDPCPLQGNNGGWNPRAAQPGPGDGDGDGLPDLCDPNASHMNTDEDFDSYQNRQDNCPTDVNGLAADNQRDTDADGIGDVCDPNPSSGDGHFHELCLVVEIDIGAGGTPFTNPLNVPPCGQGGAPAPTDPPAPTTTPNPTAGGPTPPGSTPTLTPTPTPTPPAGPPTTPPAGSPTIPPDDSPTAPPDGSPTPDGSATATPCPTAAPDSGATSSPTPAPTEDAGTPTPSASPEPTACPTGTVAGVEQTPAPAGEGPKSAVAGAQQLPSAGGGSLTGSGSGDLLVYTGLIAILAGGAMIGWTASRRRF